MGKCPKCGAQLGEDETIQWQCSSCNCKLSWNLNKFTKAIRVKQHQIDVEKQNNVNNITKKTNNRKNMVIILSILLVISLLGNGILFYQFNDIQQKLSQNIIDNTNNEVISLGSALKKSQSDLTELQSNYGELSQSYETINQKYQDASGLLSDYKQRLADKQDKISELRRKINYKNELIDVLKGNISSLKNDKKSLQSKLSTKSSSSSSSNSSTSSAYTVYVTEYGEKYHRAGCRYLWNSSSAMSVSSARAAGYTPCSVCNP